MPSDKYLKNLKSWQLEKDTQLREEDGWLSVVGLHWLSEGAQTIGRGNDNNHVISSKKCAEKIGTLTLNNGTVSFSTNEPSIMVNGITNTALVELLPDISGTPTIITSNEISFFVIIREDMIGIRVKQNSNENRIKFSGRKWFPPNNKFIIEGKYQLFDEPYKTVIPTILGQNLETEFNGEIVFYWNNQRHSLIGKELDDGSFYIIMNDASRKKTTYPAGRFLVTGIKQEDNTIKLDFNKAYNPPCAFTNFATCPLPPRENVLPFEVLAGEQYIK